MCIVVLILYVKDTANGMHELYSRASLQASHEQMISQKSNINARKCYAYNCIYL